MRKIFLFLCIIATVAANAQSWSGDKITVKQNITLRGNRIDSLKKDTASWDGRDKTIPTVNAVYDFVIGRLAALSLAGVDSSVYATIANLLNQKNILQGNINLKLAITDTVNKWVQTFYVSNDSLFGRKNNTNTFIGKLGGSGVTALYDSLEAHWTQIQYLLATVYPEENIGSGLPLTLPWNDTLRHRTAEDGNGTVADTLATGEIVFDLGGTLNKNTFINGAGYFLGITGMSNLDMQAVEFTMQTGEGAQIQLIDDAAQMAAGSVSLVANNSNIITVWPDSTLANKRFSYNGNLHGTFKPYSFIDQSFADSAYKRIYIGQTIVNNSANGRIFYDSSGYASSNKDLFWSPSLKRLGINTTSPGYEIEVIGSIRTGQLFVKGGAASGVFFHNSSESNTAQITANHTTGINNYAAGLGLSNGRHDFQIDASVYARIDTNGFAVNSKNLRIGTSSDAHASAILDIVSTTKGALFPRMNTTQQNAISSPATGLFIFNTDSAKYRFYDGSAWVTLGGSAAGGAGISDGDKGDITVSSSGTVWNIDANAVGTSEIANSNVTKAKIENVAVGKVLGNNTTSAAAPVETGAWMSLTTGTASAQATIDIDLTNYYTVYDEIKITFWDIRPATDNVSLYMRVSTDGSTYDAGASAYKYQITYSAGASAGGIQSTGAAQIVLANNVDNTSTNMNQLEVMIRKPAQTTLKPSFPIRFDYVGDSGTVYVQTNTIGLRDAAQDTQAVRFLASTGNISGSYSVTGIKY